MNNTLWWDGLDGDNLVCRPGIEIEEEYAFPCLVVTRILPSILAVAGLCFLHIACIQLKLQRTVEPNSNNNGAPNNVAVLKTKTKAKTKTKRKRVHKDSNHGVILALIIAVATLSISLTFAIDGHGTIFATNTLQGRVSAATYSIYWFLQWYLALIQVRGAKWFKGLVQMQSTKKNTIICFALPSVTKVFNLLQGRCGPFIELLLWILLVAEVLPRSWFYLVGHTLTTIFSLRAFVAISTQRVTALRKVATLQNEIRGTAADKRRRKSILRSKAFGLVIDLIAVFMVNIVPAGSILVLRSSFSSRQFILHYAVLSPLIAIGICLNTISMYAGVKKSKKRRQRSPLKSFDTTAEQLKSLPSGNSAVKQSVLPADQNENTPYVGL